ncbi:hypothetical protein LTR62_000053 [Meristemomyces frigidus]|uniref:BZIP transcription factor n=1 Tax=Meristemomyces frigidus TaxID=1508187 RepID=A0AAN7TSA1_9PEZI|nr:hypothetical protein LTR62_000053 [Meristemomyces frigidus]
MAAIANHSLYPSHGSAPQPTAYPTDHSPQATAAAALSEQQHPGLQHLQQHEDATTNKKRKTSGAPGSRGVANLTPEQLSKKRANDREAQRAIRERTRNTIQSLEQRIRELESQQPFQELQRAVAERDSALRECEDLRRRLAGVAQLAGTAAAAAVANGTQQPQAAQAAASLNGTLTIDAFIDPAWLNPDGAELATVTAQQAPLPYPAYPDHVHPDLRSPSYAVAHGSPGSPASHHDSLRQHWSPNVNGANGMSGQYSHGNGSHYDTQLPSPAAIMSGNGERLGLNYIMDQKTAPRPTSPTSWTRLPENTSPVTPLDSLLTDFITARRQLLEEGRSKVETLGPEYPSFAALNDPSRKSSSHPVSNLLIDILSKFPDISALPEKVSVLYTMFLILRWFICPCQDCYERMPEWCRPVAEQLERPHPHWVDHLPWSVSSSPETQADVGFAELFGSDSPSTIALPQEEDGVGIAEYLTDTFFRPFMRKQLSGVTPKKFDDFFVPFTTTLSLNWPHGSETVLVASGEEAGRLSPGFEHHMRNLRNWSLGTSFQQSFPDLVNEEVRIAPASG